MTLPGEDIIITQAGTGQQGLIRFSNGSVYDIDLSRCHPTSTAGNIDRALGNLGEGQAPDSNERNRLALIIKQALETSCIDEKERRRSRRASPHLPIPDWDRVRSASAPIRRIEIEGDRSFHQIPWELIDSMDVPNVSRRPIIRRLKGHREVLDTEVLGAPLSVLVVTARPFRGDIGQRAILDPLIDQLWSSGLGLELDVLRLGTFKALQDRLDAAEAADRRYHVVHFDMHGFADHDGARLFFETANDSADHLEITADPVEGEAVVTILRRHNVEVAVFNSCDSASPTGTAQSSNLAYALVESGLPAAVGMSRPLSRDAGAVFVSRLYRELASGKRRDAPLAHAVAIARSKLRRDAVSGRLRHDESASPVVYIRRTPRILVTPVAPEDSAWHERQDRHSRLEAYAARRGVHPLAGRDIDERTLRFRLFDRRGDPPHRSKPGKATLVTGMTGVGKTALLLDIARHWNAVNFVHDAVILDAERLGGVLEADDDVDEEVDRWLAAALRYVSGFDRGLDDRAIADRFWADPREFLVVIDHAESAQDKKLRRRLDEIVSQATAAKNWVVIASTVPIGWVRSVREGPHLNIGRLDELASQELIARTAGRKLTSIEIERIADLAAGHPALLIDLASLVDHTSPSSTKWFRDVAGHLVNAAREDSPQKGGRPRGGHRLVERDEAVNSLAAALRHIAELPEPHRVVLTRLAGLSEDALGAGLEIDWLREFLGDDEVADELVDGLAAKGLAQRDRVTLDGQILTIVRLNPTVHTATRAWANGQGQNSDVEELDGTSEPDRVVTQLCLATTSDGHPLVVFCQRAP